MPIRRTEATSHDYNRVDDALHDFFLLARDKPATADFAPSIAASI